jgi:hypothetical protein
MPDSESRTSYSIKITETEVQTVGYVSDEVVNGLLGLGLPAGEVHLYPGAIKHVKKKHGEEFWNNNYSLIPDILANPDYVGKNPKEPDSIELIKDGVYLLIAVKWDDDRKYFYLSSFYTLDNGEYKIRKRLSSGRIVPYSP